MITGTSSVGNQTISLTYVDGGAQGFEIAQVPVAANGSWTLDVRNVTGTSDATTLVPRPTRIRATSGLTGSATIAIKYQ